MAEGDDGARAALIALADRFVGALASGAVAGLGHLVRDVRCTVNGEPVALEALVELAGSIEAQPPVVDVETGGIGRFARRTDGAAPGGTAIMGMRLATERGRFTEIELLNSPRGRSSVFSPERLMSVAPCFDERLAAPADRARLVAIADGYFSDIEDDTAVTVFAPACRRIENGYLTTGNPAVLGGTTCAEQMEGGWFAYIAEVRGRRFPVVDRERGVVWAAAFLDVPGDVTHLDVGGGRRIELPDRMRTPRSTLLFERFKVVADRLEWIEAVMVDLPFGASHGWVATP